MKTESLLIGAAVASVFAVAAWAHGGATGVVKERMDGMGAMKEAVKMLTPMMQGQTDYDPGVVRDQAGIIAAHAGDTLAGLFPEGSHGAPSEAKDTIWQDWEGFSALAAKLLDASEGLALAADNGLMMSGATQADGMMAGGMMADGMTGSDDMMGGEAMGAGGAMMGGAGMEMDFTAMPADGAFTMLGQVCSACHSRFRVEK